MWKKKKENAFPWMAKRRPNCASGYEMKLIWPSCFPLEKSCLLVTVAVGTGEGVHDVAKSLVVGDEAEGDLVVKLHGVAGRVVGKGGGAADDVLAAPDVKVLPDGPDAVDHAVVDEEDGVVGRGVEVLELRRSTTEPVSATVDTDGVVVVAVALHELLEVLDVDHVEDELGDLLVGVVGAADVVVEVTGQAAAVVVEVALDVLEGRADGTKVGDEVAEGTVLNAATASTGLEVDVHGVKVDVLSASDVLAVATHGPLITVEDFALLNGTSVAGPVPVRHVTGVAAKVLQILLERVDEESVPCEEVGSHVNLSGVLNVSGHIFVVASEDTRVIGLLVGGHTLGRSVVEALDGVGERLALLLRHVPPLLANLSVVVVASTIAAIHVLTHTVVGHVGHILPGIAIGDLVGVVVRNRR
jgi:hypothetical protein